MRSCAARWRRRRKSLPTPREVRGNRFDPEETTQSGQRSSRRRPRCRSFGTILYATKRRAAAGTRSPRRSRPKKDCRVGARRRCRARDIQRPTSGVHTEEVGWRRSVYRSGSCRKESARRSHASDFAPGSSRRRTGHVGAAWSEKRDRFGFARFGAISHRASTRSETRLDSSRTLLPTDGHALSPYWARSAFLSNLPTLVLANASTNRIFCGTANLEITPFLL